MWNLESNHLQVFPDEFAYSTLIKNLKQNSEDYNKPFYKLLLDLKI